MKAVMISIQRPHTDNIKALIKTIEVRKNKPNIQNPFPCFIYETKANGGCGKVIAEFVCDKIKKFEFDLNYNGNHSMSYEDFESIGLDGFELYDYLKDKDGYGWHISNLKIYDKPKELSEFETVNVFEPKTKHLMFRRKLKRPPQSWCYVEVEE